MGLYNFQERFAPYIMEGLKTHTIRAIRAHADKPGNTLHLYTGLRQKGARLLMRVKCTKVEQIWITLIENPPHVSYGYLDPEGLYRIQIDDHYLRRDEIEELARRDGFGDFSKMIRFWREPTNRLPFTGHVIHWKYEGVPDEVMLYGAGSGLPLGIFNRRRR